MRTSPITKYKRHSNVFAVTSIALSLGHVGARLLELPAQSLIGSPRTLFCKVQICGKVYLFQVCSPVSPSLEKETSFHCFLVGTKRIVALFWQALAKVIVRTLKRDELKACVNGGVYVAV